VRMSEGEGWEGGRQGGASTFELELPFVRRSTRAIKLPYCSTSLTFKDSSEFSDRKKTVDEYSYRHPVDDGPGERMKHEKKAAKKEQT